MSTPTTHLLEDYKSLLDYFKHLTTLSTGSIVLLATFLEKVFEQPKWRALIVISLASFTASILAAVAAHTICIANFPGRKPKWGPWTDAILGLSLLIAWSGFLLGVVSLSIFASRNLF